jgi:glycosyltransferase involved in cell wall biosynthesis
MHWIVIGKEAVDKAFKNGVLSDDPFEIKVAKSLFLSIIDDEDINEAWPYIKYAELIVNVEEKIKIYKKAYNVEPNIYSCFKLIKIYLENLNYLDAIEWLNSLIKIDCSNSYIDYYINLIKPKNFDSELYLMMNPDLQSNTDVNTTKYEDVCKGKRKISPAMHYVLHGIKEDRKYAELPKDFDPQEYKRLHNDLKNFSDDELKNHYLIHGMKEHRNYKDPYTLWKNKNFPDANRIEEIRLILKSLAYAETKNILFSVIVPVYNTPANFLKECLDSVLAQVYPNWELCIANDGSTESYVKEILEKYKKKDGRIKVIHNEKNQHISCTSNSALSLATGEFVVFLDHDDVLSVDALYEFFMLLNHKPETDMIYSDEDKIDPNGNFINPFFKPDWSPDTLLSKMYTCHLSAYRRSIVDELGGLRKGFEGSQDWDLALRFTEKTQRIEHIPKILYHWRMHEDSASMNSAAKPYAHIASKKAVQEALIRRNEVGEVVGDHGTYNIHYVIKEHKKVSIIILTKDLGDILDKCLTSIFDKTIYPNYEILVVDNNSTEKNTHEIFAKWRIREPNRFKIVTLNIPFNYSKLNNYAAQKCTGDYLLFLNNDTEVINQDWLNAMVEQVQRPSIGAVGALLLYPDETIQHAGVTIGLGGIAAHRFCKMPGNCLGYFANVQYQNNVAAVTGACLMCRKDVFNQVGGFEEKLPVAFNDIDLCLKILDSGYNNIYTPSAKLYHHESKTRGYEDTTEKQQRFQKEIDFFRNKWKKYIYNDPYYSPNLTKDGADYSINIK